MTPFQLRLPLLPSSITFLIANLFCFFCRGPIAHLIVSLLQSIPVCPLNRLSACSDIFFVLWYAVVHFAVIMSAHRVSLYAESGTLKKKKVSPLKGNAAFSHCSPLYMLHVVFYYIYIKKTLLTGIKPPSPCGNFSLDTVYSAIKAFITGVLKCIV